MADQHVLFKQGIKEIADQHGKAVSFMAKYAPAEAGNSCHIHLSLWKNSQNAFWNARPRSQSSSPSSHAKSKEPTRNGSTLFRRFLGGLMKYSPELCLFFAPPIKRHQRYQPGR